MKFMLETNGYRVLAASGGNEAIIMLADSWIDLVLHDAALSPVAGKGFVEWLKQIKPHVPVMALDRSLKYVELLDRIKVMSARKRGPRKGTLSAMRCGQNKKAVTA